jgi:hypothetical protein
VAAIGNRPQWSSASNVTKGVDMHSTDQGNASSIHHKG